ncbi:hypothetical protein TSTA_089820 [Paecilomyces variotii No. 5]|uniref:RNase H type-1 domain-containing protein n=1 Tax=Byssochlamys spectabilis (strain No. 5 / NBRC 109023) TaxID=1356009 RepID=V5GD50_BYSSN|nr:hypothetical protein TSTA_089820 [Paecilomyces variotii No. 5]
MISHDCSNTMDIDPADVQIFLEFIERAALEATETRLRVCDPAIANNNRLVSGPDTTNAIATEAGSKSSVATAPEFISITEGLPPLLVSHNTKSLALTPIRQRHRISKPLKKWVSRLSKTNHPGGKARLDSTSRRDPESKQRCKDAKKQRKIQKRLEASTAPSCVVTGSKLPDPLPRMADVVWIRDRETALCRAMQNEQSLRPKIGQRGVFWTDGSRLHDGRAGAAVAYHVLSEEGSYEWTGTAYHFCPCRLPLNSDDVELYAISVALEIALAQADSRDPVVIFSDSHTALQFVRDWRTFDDMSHHFSRVAGADVLRRLADLQSANVEVRFEWVPGHSGVLGNTIADKMAKHAAENGHGPEGICRTEVAISPILSMMMRG